MPSNEFLQVAFFIAAAYSVGLLSSLLSRLLVEFVSERGLRSFVFSCFAHVTLDKAISECSYSDTKFKNDSRHDLLIKTWKKFLIWNGVYRSALRRTTRTDEVDCRRSQGRLVRNLLVPTVIAPLILVKNPWSLILPIFLFILLLFIYAYSEYVIFAEAYDITKA